MEAERNQEYNEYLKVVTVCAACLIACEIFTQKTFFLLLDCSHVLRCPFPLLGQDCQIIESYVQHTRLQFCPYY